MCEALCTKCRCLQSPEEGTRSPGVGIRGICELPGVGGGTELRFSAGAACVPNHCVISPAPVLLSSVT